jgi:hypothetical protein
VRNSPTLIYHSENSKIPGIEGKDYPSYSHIPETGFTCSGSRQKDKMFADKRTRCQVREQRFSAFMTSGGYCGSEARLKYLGTTGIHDEIGGGFSSEKGCYY